MKDRLYRELLDNLYDGVYFVDRSRVITYWNNSALRITGYSAEDVLGRNCNDNLLSHVDEKGKFLCKSGCPLAASMKDGKRRELNVYLRHKDGYMLPVLIKVNVIRDGNGGVIGGIESFNDNSAVIAIKERAADLEKIALIDHLTGVGNRRYGNMSLQNKLAELKRYGWAFGVLFADLDNFKHINDTYGHNTGDKVLKIVAQTMLGNMRSFDFIFRWGGEEFLVILTNVDRPVLRSAAERLRILVQNAGLRMGSKVIKVTTSIGGTLADPRDSQRGLLSRIDRFMYDCKKAGKNQCIVDGTQCTPVRARRPMEINR